jgi:hypothetical protein
VLSPLRRKIGELLHVSDGHAGVAQPQQELDPGQVGGGVAALAARRPADRADETRFFVVAEGVG